MSCGAGGWLADIAALLLLLLAVTGGYGVNPGAWILA